MAFAIVSTCVMFVDFIIYCVAVGKMRRYIYICDHSYNYYYGDCYYTANSTGVGIYSCLLALSIVEFAIALTVAICCCKYGCSGCCYGETRGVRLFFAYDYHLHYYLLHLNTPLSRTVQLGTGSRFGVTELLRCIQIHMERAGCLLIPLDISCFNHRFHCFTAIIY